MLHNWLFSYLYKYAKIVTGIGTLFLSGKNYDKPISMKFQNFYCNIGATID